MTLYVRINDDTPIEYQSLDNAYLDDSCLGTLQVTAWIPLLDTNVTNGCMQVRTSIHRDTIEAILIINTTGRLFKEVTEKEKQQHTPAVQEVLGMLTWMLQKWKRAWVGLFQMESNQ